MWHTASTDIHHNIFGLEIQNPPSPKKESHDPYVLYKSKDFDIRHYTSISTITIMEKEPRKAEKILSELRIYGTVGEDDALLNLGPKEVAEFLSKYYNNDVLLQGIECAYDRFLRKSYHIFYFILSEGV